MMMGTVFNQEKFLFDISFIEKRSMNIKRAHTTLPTISIGISA
jgi:hypothetical protein